MADVLNVAMMTKFENEIRNTIFSMELFWREIYAYVDLVPDATFQGESVLDFII